MGHQLIQGRTISFGYFKANWNALRGRKVHPVSHYTLSINNIMESSPGMQQNSGKGRVRTDKLPFNMHWPKSQSQSPYRKSHEDLQPHPVTTHLEM